jgi:hypothetical protein
MKVPSLLSGVSDLVSPAKTDAKAAAGAVTPAATSAAPLPSAAAAMRAIVSQYDMTDITPNDFSNMIQQLYAKGAASAKDMQELSSIRSDLEAAGIGADQSVNLQEFYQQRLATAQADAAQSPDSDAAQGDVQAVAARLSWVQKFAAVRQAGGSAGVNAVA